MTAITLNSQSVDEKILEDMSLNSLMDIIQEKYAKNDEFFTEVLIDGKVITEKDEIQLLESPAAIYSKIDFTIKNSMELAFDALDTCTDHLDTLMDKIKVTADSYRQNNIDKANEQFIEITDILNLFVELITTIHHTLRVESDTEMETGKTFQDLEIHLLSILKAFVPAKEKNDIIMLCDLLEYELIDNLTQWKITAIPELKRLRTT